MRPSSFSAAVPAALLLVLITLFVAAPSAPASASQPGKPGKDYVADVVIVGFESGTPKARKGAAALSVMATDVEPLSPLARAAEPVPQPGTRT